jgi:DNA-binding MarR family transcriptional regulator
MITIKDITDKFAEVFYMPDVTPIRMIIAATLSPYMDGSPVWMMLVASSSAGKTELLNLVRQVKHCSFISNITENTLLSGSRAPGAKGRDGDTAQNVSLLKRMPKRGGVLIWPEFNTLLDERSEKKAAILSQLRSVYDGSLRKITGLGDDISWDGKICVIGACTEKYFEDMEYLDAAGPRFIIYTLPELTQKQGAERLAKVRTNEHLFEKTSLEIQSMIAEFYQYKLDNGVPGHLDVPEEFDAIINKIAYMIGVASTAVVHGFKGDIKDVYGRMDGTRFYRSSRKLAQAMMVLEEKPFLSKKDQKAIIKLLFDTIPRKRHRILSTLSQFKRANTKGLAHYLHLPTDTVRDTLKDLNAIFMVTREAGSSAGVGDMWFVKEEYRELFTEHEEGIKWQNKELIHIADDEEEGNEEQRIDRLKLMGIDDEAHKKEVMDWMEKETDDIFKEF